MASENTSQQTFNIGMLGCGNIAGTWLEATSQHDRSQIVMTYDLDAAAAQKRADECGGRAAGSLDDILHNPDINMVIIGTPTPSHPDLVMQAADAGKHILCEKPMAVSMALCQQMIDKVAGCGVKLAVGHSLRFWGAFYTCRQLVDAGRIGTPVSAEVNRVSTAKPRPAADRPVPSSDHWRSNMAQSGGPALEMFIHELDFTRSVLGQVASVSCEIGGEREYDGLISPRLFTAVVTFTSGASAVVRYGGVVALPAPGWWVAGTAGSARFSSWGGPLELYLPDADGPQTVTCDDRLAYYLELCDLIDAIDADAAPSNSGRNGMENVALGLALYNSFETGRRIDFKDGLPVGIDAEYRYGDR